MDDRAGHKASSSPLANFHAAADRDEANAAEVAAYNDLELVLARARALSEQLPKSREASLVTTKIDEAAMWNSRVKPGRA